jgi:4'-phosphopantetheinyl transferase
VLAVLDLWLQPVDEASVRWAEQQACVLDDQETQRWQRYLTAETRALFVVAHVVTRNVLSRYDDRAPESWRFDRGAHGRPEIVGGPPGLRFNISHTEGMVAVLVHGEADCGVDMEHPSQSMDMLSVSRRVFTDAEQAAIFSQPPERQADRFYQLWTLKEAFIKAKGKGFALPLKQFSFTIHDEHLIEFDCACALDPAPNQWQFFTQRPESGHIVSIAAHRGSGADDTSVVKRQLGSEATGGSPGLTD